MANYLDKTGLEKVWQKVKDHDTLTQTACNNYTDSAVQTAQGTLQANINAVSGRVTTVEGYFTSGKAKEAVKATQDGDGEIISSTYIKATQKGVANGVATLDANGTVPASQLPSFVDDIVEGYYHNGKFYTTSAHTTEIPGESGKIYVDLVSLKTYRWSGTAFVVISETITIGTVTGTAYDGGLGAGLRNDFDSFQSATEEALEDIEGSIPTTYIKNASVSGNVLTITKQDNTTVTFTDNNDDTGATSVEVNGSGNAVTSASYSATTRKLTLTKGTTFLTSHLYRPIKVNGTQKLANNSATALDLVAGSNITLSESGGAVTINSSYIDTGATDVEVTGNGNVVSGASYDATTRKITLAKGVTALTSHQAIKTLKTDNTTAQTASASETITGSGTINLHKVSKTGNYNDLLNKPTIPTVNYPVTDVQLNGTSIVVNKVANIEISVISDADLDDILV